MTSAHPVGVVVSTRAQQAASSIGAASIAAGFASSVLEQARAQSVLIVTPVPVDPNHRGPDLRLGVGLGSELLLGDDRNVFDDSLGISVRLATDRLFGLSLSFAFDRYVHMVKLGNLVEETVPELLVWDFALGVAYPIYHDAFRFSFGAAAGYTSFGYRDPWERGGLLLDLVFDASVNLSSGLGMGLEIRQRMAVAEGIEGFEVSSPITFAIHILYDLRLK